MANFQCLLLFGMVKLSRSLRQSCWKCSSNEDEKLLKSSMRYLCLFL